MGRSYLTSEFGNDDHLPWFRIVTSKVSAQDMFRCLVDHGCADLSLDVDPDRYSESAVASGGFGDVWQAWMKDGTMVAVKCLRLHIILEGDRKGMKRTMRELYNWSQAKHENIQQLLGIVLFQGRLGMVSTWRPDGNLQQYIKNNPYVERHQLCIQLNEGVAYLHKIGMVHGDIKAINILVCPEGIVKITDFDYSILSESALRFSETSKLGGGTVRWMAPELLLLEEDEDAPQPTRTMKTDVYALGMTMLEIISGEVPYHQYQHDRTIILALEKKKLPKCPEMLSAPDERVTRMWNLLLECWDHDPEARPCAPSLLTSLIRLHDEGISFYPPGWNNTWLTGHYFR
ncbi:kinase-like protein [Ceratobasidium sp. AG-I]|nr:kinase-like protein [Ceratobasidium sp. AG-I]